MMICSRPVSVTAIVGLLVTLGCALESVQTNAPSQLFCEQLLYASSCVEAGCMFCCAQVPGQQCMSPLMLQNKSFCDPQFVLSQSSSTVGNESVVPSCNALCASFSSSCDSCVAADWCAFCSTGGIEGDGGCVGARTYCPDDAFVTTCESGHSSPPPNYFSILLYACVAVTTLLLVIVLAVCCRRFRRNFVTPARRGETPDDIANAEWLRRHLEQQQEQQQQQQAPRETPRASGGDEAAPLLANEATSPAIPSAAPAARVSINDAPNTAAVAAAPHNESFSASRSQRDGDHEEEDEEEEPEAAPIAVADLEDGEERLCQICLDARPTVVFLPCYHAYCCSECSEQIRPNRRRNGIIACPFCRARITAMVDLRSLWHGEKKDQ